MKADPFDNLAFNFWRQLSEEQAELRDGVALYNPTTPLLLSNAAWFPRVGEFDSVTDWYAGRDLTPAMITTAIRNDALDHALNDSPFTLERAFSFIPPEPLKSVDTATLVEQVSWAQSRALGEVLAGHYGMPEYGIALGRTLADAMQDDPGILAFLAYGDKPVGAMIVLETSDLLAAMLLGGERDALLQRLADEATDRNVDAWVLAPLEEGVTVKDARTLERWSIR